MRQTPRECEEKWESLQRGICCLRSTGSTEAVIVAATRPGYESTALRARSCLSIEKAFSRIVDHSTIVIPVVLAVAILGCALYRGFV
jgi:hypothetical protein